MPQPKKGKAMGIEEIPGVRIHGRSEQRFIIARIKVDGKEKRILWAGVVGSHIELVLELEELDIEVSPEGGGKVEVDRDAKTIYVSHYSRAYGAFDFETAHSLLAAEYRGFAIAHCAKPRQKRSR